MPKVAKYGILVPNLIFLRFLLNKHLFRICIRQQLYRKNHSHISISLIQIREKLGKHSYSKVSRNNNICQYSAQNNSIRWFQRQRKITVYYGNMCITSQLSSLCFYIWCVAIWYHLYNLKNVKNRTKNGTKSRKVSHIFILAQPFLMQFQCYRRPLIQKRGFLHNPKV